MVRKGLAIALVASSMLLAASFGCDDRECGAFVLEDCRDREQCLWMISDAACPNNGNPFFEPAACFFASCAECPEDTSCEVVHGSDGAGQCVEGVTCTHML